jgi:hypothetical protein
VASNTETTKTVELRTNLARVVGGACSLIALIIIIGAALVALRGNINSDNSLVKLVIDVADTFDGPFSRTDGIFDFTGKNAVTKEALVNWAIAAAVWLGIGRIASSLIKP